MAKPYSIDHCINFAERNAEIYLQASSKKSGEDRAELIEECYIFSMITELLKDLKTIREGGFINGNNN